MKFFYLFIILLFSFFKLQAQCSIVVLGSQADVNTFVANNNNNCSNISRLDIGVLGTPNDINDISGLSGLTSVSVDLRIYNTNLTSLNGLQNLTAAGGLSLSIKNNPNLLTIALNGISTTNSSSINIDNNQSLQSINGFGNTIIFLLFEGVTQQAFA